MKFLAILRDSIREAIDFKAFYAMTVISVLIALFFACVSFTAAPVDTETLLHIVTTMPPGPNPAASSFGDLYSVIYFVTDVESPSPSSKPWKDEFRFKLNIMDSRPGMFRAWPDGKSAAMSMITVSSSRQNFSRSGVKRGSPSRPKQEADFLKAQLTNVCHLEVINVKTLADKINDIRFEIEARGTDAVLPLWPHRLGIPVRQFKTEQFALRWERWFFLLRIILLATLGPR